MSRHHHSHRKFNFSVSVKRQKVFLNLLKNFTRWKRKNKSYSLRQLILKHYVIFGRTMGIQKGSVILIMLWLI